MLSPGMLRRSRVRASSTLPMAIFQFTGALADVSSVAESFRAMSTSASCSEAVFTVTVSCGSSMPCESTKKLPMLPLMATPGIRALVSTAARVSSMPSTSMRPRSSDEKFRSTFRCSTSSRFCPSPSSTRTSCRSRSKRNVSRSRFTLTSMPVVSAKTAVALPTAKSCTGGT